MTWTRSEVSSRHELNNTISLLVTPANVAGVGKYKVIYFEAFTNILH